MVNSYINNNILLVSFKYYFACIISIIHNKSHRSKSIQVIYTMNCVICLYPCHEKKELCLTYGKCFLSKKKNKGKRQKRG